MSTGARETVLWAGAQALPAGFILALKVMIAGPLSSTRSDSLSTELGKDPEHHQV